MNRSNNRIAYIEDDWTGELFGTSGLIILKGTEVMLFTMNHRTINTYEELVETVKTHIKVYKMAMEKKAKK